MSVRASVMLRQVDCRRRGIVMAMLSGNLFLAACSGDAEPLIEAVEVRELGIETLAIVPPENVVLPLAVNPGERVAFGLTGFRADGVTEVDVSGDDRNWRVSDSAIGTVDGNGVFVARDDATLDDTVTVSVGIGDVVASGFDILVRQSAIRTLEAISGADALEPCQAESYGITGRFGDGTERAVTAEQIEWSATGTGVRLEEQENGRVEVVASEPGAIALVATVGSATQDKPITVNASLDSIAIGPATLAASVGDTQDLIATGTYDAGQGGPLTEVVITDNVTWSVAEGSEFIGVSNDAPTRGRVSVNDAGAAQVQVSCGNSVVQLATYSALANDGDDDAISFQDEEDGAITISLTGGPVQLRASTGSTFDSDDEITFEPTALWTTPEINTPVIFLQTAGSNQGTVTPQRIGGTTVTIRFEGEEETVNVFVQ